jgi:hypothetical protein
MHVSEENTIVFDNSDGILAFPQCKMLVNSKNSRISSLVIPRFKNLMKPITMEDLVQVAIETLRL